MSDETVASQGGDVARGIGWQGLLEALPTAATLIDAQGIILGVNEAFLAQARRWGRQVRREDRVGRPMITFASTDLARERFGGLLKGVLAGTASQVPWQFAGGEGEPLWVGVRAQPVTGEDGKVQGALVLWKSIDEQVRQERLQTARQHVQEALWRMADLEDLPEVLRVLVEELRRLCPVIRGCSVQLYDEARKQWTGYGIWGQEVEYVPEIRIAAAVEECWRQQRPVYRPDLDAEDPYGETRPGGWFVKGTARERSVLDVPFTRGTLAVNSFQPRAFTPSDVALLEEMARLLSVGFARVSDLEHLAQRNRQLEQEIGKRRRMEEDLIRLERLRVSGELAAGVAHNLNNILTAVLGPAQLLQRWCTEPRVLREVEVIITAAVRARDLIRRLSRAVRSHQEEVAGAVDLNAQIRTAVETARPRWKDEPEARGIAVQVILELAEVPPIRGRPDELGDVLFNLLLNAVDAMPQGGRITFTTRVTTAGVQLQVIDTGIGMDEETRRRVFEPFFTTKRDVGSGLGLTTVRGVVLRCGGTIAVDSAPGRGSTFTLDFPLANQPAEPAISAIAPEPSGRSGRVLIVEDDEGVSSVLRHLLSPRYTVQVAGDGRQALAGWPPGQCDVALIDLGLPGLPGDQVAARMRRLDPRVVTVLITGWVLEPDSERCKGFDFVLQKPFADLAKVESVVAQAIAFHDARARTEPSLEAETGETGTVGQRPMPPQTPPPPPAAP
ncbi:MAG: ATP-binding protein [Candidatus Latescibacterota bacterium]|jgi:signal transduction histidine kinase/FixJ family two-component response regulator